MSPVTGAVRIMPAVGHGVPGTSTGVIETDSVFTQRCVTHTKSGWTVHSVTYSTTYYPLLMLSPLEIAEEGIMLSCVPSAFIAGLHIEILDF